MDTNQPSKVNPSKPFPTINEQFVETWKVTNANVIHLLILGAVSLLLFFGFTILMGAVGLVGGFGLGIFTQFSRGIEGVPPAAWEIIALFIFLCLSGFIVISTVVNAALVLILNDYPNKNLGVSTALKHGVRRVIPLFIAGIITFFLITGSFFFLFFPGVAAMFMLSFVGYEIILKDKKPFEALSASATVFLQHTSEIVSRILVFYLVNFALVYMVPGLFSKANSEIVVAVGILSFLIRLYMGWYGMVYSLVLYREASARTDYSKKTSALKWIYVSSVLGWLIIFAIVFAVVNLVSANSEKIVPAIQRELQKEMKKNEEPSIPFPGDDAIINMQSGSR